MPRPAARTRPGRSLGLRVDPIRCTAFGYCAEFGPELFDLDDWGYAWPRRRDIPPELEALARETAKRCPTGAIRVEAVAEG